MSMDGILITFVCLCDRHGTVDETTRIWTGYFRISQLSIQCYFMPSSDQTSDDFQSGRSTETFYQLDAARYCPVLQQFQDQNVTAEKLPNRIREATHATIQPRASSVKLLTGCIAEMTVNNSVAILCGRYPFRRRQRCPSSYQYALANAVILSHRTNIER